MLFDTCSFSVLTHHKNYHATCCHVLIGSSGLRYLNLKASARLFVCLFVCPALAVSTSLPCLSGNVFSILLLTSQRRILPCCHTDVKDKAPRAAQANSGQVPLSSKRNQSASLGVSLRSLGLANTSSCAQQQQGVLLRVGQVWRVLLSHRSSSRLSLSCSALAFAHYWKL